MYELVQEQEFDDIEEFDRFIKEHEVDLINIGDKEFIKESIPEVNKIEEEIEIISEDTKEIIDDTINNNTILESVNNKEETYITYHVYICNENDTLDTIAQQYNIDINLIKEYNTNIEITSGTKIIIPFTNE